MTFVLAPAASVSKSIASIAKRSKQLTSDIHNVGVQCLAHALPPSMGGHGDITLIDRLYKALGSANAPEAFKAWVKEYSPITWNGDGEVKLIPSTNKMFKPFDIDGANSNPYWNKIEVKKTPLTYAAMLKVLEGMEKRVIKAQEDGLIAEGEDVTAMLALAKRAQDVAKGAPKAADAALQLAA